MVPRAAAPIRDPFRTGARRQAPVPPETPPLTRPGPGPDGD